MLISAYKRGSLYISVLLAALGTALLATAMLWIKPFIICVLLFVWYVFCSLLYLRFTSLTAELKNKYLHITKGRFFKTEIKVNALNVTAFKILQTPFSKKLGSSTCVVYTSGKVTILWGIRYENAKALQQVLCGDIL